MLERSFLILPGIGVQSERRLWQQGITNWQQFLARRKIPGISMARKTEYDTLLHHAREWVSIDDYQRFVALLPTREHWRLYPHLHSHAVYLDIEVDGIGQYSNPSVVGIYDQHRRTFAQLVQGQDLSVKRLQRAFEGCQCIVTFNGKTFDLPYLALRYPGVVPSVVMLDLRHLAPRCGLHGGLKYVEHQLGLRRDPEIQVLRGEDAIRLWRAWQRTGSLSALRLLLQYNRADTMHLQLVMDHVYERLVSQALVLPNS